MGVLRNSSLYKLGETVPIVLEFHHVRGTKLDEVSRLIGRGASIPALRAEIAKCDVLCSNCHRRLTVNELSWYKRHED